MDVNPKRSFTLGSSKDDDDHADNDPASMGIRVCHLQFFLISLLFQAGIYPRHTKEQEKYRSYMVYVYIFQRFLTFVLYKLHITITREKWPK